MENKYFTPDISDIRVGYECEFNTNNLDLKWVPIIVSGPNQVFEKAMIIYRVLEEITQNRIRVPYLTKEQIEAKGWMPVGKSIDIWFTKEGNFNMGSWTAYKAMLQYGLHDQRLRIFVIDTDKTEYDCFRGECKDINTFRYICKLLNI